MTKRLLWLGARKYMLIMVILEGLRRKVDKMLGSLEKQANSSLRFTGTIFQVLRTICMRPKMIGVSGQHNTESLTLMGSSVVGIKLDP